MIEINKIHKGDAWELAHKLNDESIDCIITSPPYWALRNYGMEGQFGMENSPDEYVQKLAELFRILKKKLKKTGTCWVNLGDTYGGKGNKGKCKDPKYAEGRNGQVQAKNRTAPSKSLCMIPFKFALAMAKQGWILRNTIIWHKPNAMPSSVTDRFTVDFEYFFFFVKSKKYFFNPILEPIKESTKERIKYPVHSPQSQSKTAMPQMQYACGARYQFSSRIGRNKRCVWNIPTNTFRCIHFAVFPESLIETPLKAGCPEGGIVLDPFMGSGTTGVMAKKQNKKFIGFELNPEYIQIANKRIA